MKDETSLASFNASYYGDMNLSITMNISQETKEEDEKILLTDMETFYKSVIEKIKILAK